MPELQRLSQEYKFSIDTLDELHRVYGYELESVVRALKQPSQRFYVRVNTSKITVEDLTNTFLQQGWLAQRDESIEEAVYFERSEQREIPYFQKKVVVDKITAESVLQGANVYAPGVKKCTKIHRGDNVSVLDDQDSLVGSGTTLMNEDEILRLRRGIAVEVRHQMYTLPKLGETEEISRGYFYPQSLPAMITTRVLNPVPGDTVVDMTCSPGGKLSHVFQLTGGKAKLIGFDRNQRKVSTARNSLQRLGYSANLIVHDSRYLDIDFPNLKADKCLVDPPCSALGVRPKTYEFTSKTEIQSLSSYQRQFLRTASRILRKDGLLTYSVCTVTTQECEDVIEYAITECDLEPEKQNIFIGSPGLPGSSASKYLQRFHPHRHDYGYFIALFRKRS